MISFFGSDPGVVSASLVMCTNTNLAHRNWLVDPILVVSGFNIKALFEVCVQ
jgi:hypothetical protein